MSKSRQYPGQTESPPDSLRLESSVEPDANDQFLIGDSPKIRRLRKLIKLYASTNESLLITGESGTGKTLLAERIHAMSDRRAEMCSTISLAEVANSISRSDFFGHVRGSFTDAFTRRSGMLCSNDKGTLFLDELGKSSLEVQSQLLNILEHRGFYPVGSDRIVKVDVRFVLAMSEKPEALLKNGKLLGDLWARVQWFQISLPPLRERREDIPALLKLILAKNARNFGYAKAPIMEDQVLELLASWDWPYNLRGLDSAVRLLLTHAQGAPLLTKDHMVGNLLEKIWKHEPRRKLPDAARILRAVKREGSILGAARALGLARNTVKSRLRQSENGRRLLAELPAGATSSKKRPAKA